MIYFIGNSIIKNNEITSLSEQLPIGTDNEVYELFRVQNGHPLFLDDHIQRFLHTTASANITPPPADKLLSLIQWLIICNNITDSNVRLSISADGTLQGGFVPSSFPTKQMYENGVKASILMAERNNPKAKIYHADMRQAAQQQQLSTDTYESLLVNAQGEITEGSRSNAYFIKDNSLFTAPDNLVLGGIMRKKIIEICNREAINIVYHCVRLDELENYNSAFISSTPARILPVIQIENITFARQNPILDTLIDRMELEVQKQTNI